MHTIDIDDALELVRDWRGVDHVFSDIDPARTAHLVIDMQNAFLEEGMELEVPQSRETVDNINRISAALSAAGGVNIFTRMVMDEDFEQNWTIWLRYFCGDRRSANVKAILRPGTHGQALYPAIAVGASDIVIEKNRYSCFFPGASPLQSILRERGIDTLIISGTVTNCCCEATARDAMQLNYKVIFVSDATSALNDADHNAALKNMVTIFADVMDTDTVIGFIEQPVPVTL
ncbi:cysteine hydrolase [Mesorhizobium sp. BR1-1-16]|uniref:isochorismatase family protein n=1 Tax=Mesorhizobium sp. BR1-1-16 TaxID=2876653 RepID=UPI001CCEC3E5|nr:cysteine hydrolase [Mesorhizobium sp. BR1-1-16]MBZ9938229.1 cysteine hydrolase [Mesorhizobium sp. BR1-1-16]